MKYLSIIFSTLVLSASFAEQHSPRQLFIGQDALTIIKYIEEVNNNNELKSNLSIEEFKSVAKLKLETFVDTVGHNFEQHLTDVVVTENNQYYCENHFYVWVGEGQKIEKSNGYIQELIYPVGLFNTLTTEFTDRASLIVESSCIKKSSN